MYKSRLQELCQSKKWKLPEYTTSRGGLDHCPQFGATVVVNASLFSTPHFSRSIKDAHNLVAKIAFDHLTGTSSAHALQISHTSIDAQQPKLNEPVQSSFSSGVKSPHRNDKKVENMTHLYKNQLQIYAQKRNLNLPVYNSDREGPPHATLFKSKVMLEGKIYESNEFFSTIKDAENAAAKVALMSVSSDGTDEEDPGFFKNLLQELAQREYSCLPAYTTTRSGLSHNLVFVSTVDIHDLSFTGQEAKTKKLAEMNAAKVAYIALRERNCDSSGHHVNDSSPKLLLPDDELPDRHISASNPIPDRVYVDLVQCNEGVHHQRNEAKLTEVCTDEVQNICQPKVDTLPFRWDDSSISPVAPSHDLSRPGVDEFYEISPSSSGAAASSHKKIKVFPATPNMRLPAGVMIMRKDDKWVALTTDSTYGI